jgi:hypothetical protein
MSGKLHLPIKKPQLSLCDMKTDYHSAYGSIIIGTREKIKPTVKIRGLIDTVKKLFKKFSL